jgi:hypothetical protein
MTNPRPSRGLEVDYQTVPTQPRHWLEKTAVWCGCALVPLSLILIIVIARVLSSLLDVGPGAARFGIMAALAMLAILSSLGVAASLAALIRGGKPGEDRRVPLMLLSLLMSLLGFLPATFIVLGAWR